MNPRIFVTTIDFCYYRFFIVCIIIVANLNPLLVFSFSNNPCGWIFAWQAINSQSILNLLQTAGKKTLLVKFALKKNAIFLLSCSLSCVFHIYIIQKVFDSLKWQECKKWGPQRKYKFKIWAHIKLKRFWAVLVENA